MKPSVVDLPFSLAELLDLGVFREVCEAFTQSCGVGLRVFAADGRALVPSPESSPLCAALKQQNPAAERACAAVLEQVSNQTLSDSTAVQVNLYCGCRYAVFPLSLQFDVVGRVVLGPYREGPWQPERLLQTMPQMKAQVPALRTAAGSVPELEPERFKKQVRFLAKVMDAFLFINAKRLVTTRLHLEAILDMRNSMARGPEEDALLEKDESGKAKGLF